MQTQLEKLLAELVKVAPNVTKGDRELFVKQPHNYQPPHDNTIKNYLKGDGSNSDLAYDLLYFFRKQIEKRDKILKEK